MESEMDNHGTEMIIRRSSNLWFKEGSAVIQAEDVQFRVHLGLIAANSSIFNDMMSLPRPDSDEETVDGCVLIRLSDKAVDVECMLNALYDRGYFCGGTSRTFAIACSLLRMASKYMMNRLRMEAMAYLAQWHPPTLSAWSEALNNEKMTWPNLSSLIDEVILCRETDAACLLPAALYDCMGHSVQDILRCVNEELSGPSDQATWFLRTWSIGRERLMARQHTAFLFLLDDIYDMPSCDSDSCFTWHRCGQRRVEIWKEVFDYRAPTLLDLDLWDSNCETVLCRFCKDTFDQRYAVIREEAWNDLPSFFDLPDWGKLLNRVDLLSYL